jgi:hypothetical protein
VPSLDDWEKQWNANPQEITQPKVVPVNFRSASAMANNGGADVESLALVQRN